MKRYAAIKMACKTSGASFISLDTRTNVELTGRCNPHKGTITKVTSKVRGILFERSDGYHNLVCKRIKEEGGDPTSFKLGERRWGEHIKDTPLITHNGNLYLQVIATGCGEIQYFYNGEPVRYEDGVMVDPEGYIISGIPKTRINADQGGIKNKVITRCYNIESIIQVRAFGKIWK